MAGSNGGVYKKADFKRMYLDALDENSELRKAIIAILLSVGGAVEVTDELVASISESDKVETEQDPQKQSHLVWVKRVGGVQH